MTHAHHDHADAHHHHHDGAEPHVHLPHSHAIMPLTPLVMSAMARLAFVAVILALIWGLFFWAIQ